MSEKGERNRRVGWVKGIPHCSVERESCPGVGVGRLKTPRRLVTPHSDDDDQDRIVVPACDGVKMKKGRELGTSRGARGRWLVGESRAV